MAGNPTLTLVVGAAFEGSFDTVVDRSVAGFRQVGLAMDRMEARSHRLGGLVRLKNTLYDVGTAYGRVGDRVARLRRETRGAAPAVGRMSAAMASARERAVRLNRQLAVQCGLLLCQRLASQGGGVGRWTGQAPEKISKRLPG